MGQKETNRNAHRSSIRKGLWSRFHYTLFTHITELPGWSSSAHVRIDGKDNQGTECTQRPCRRHPNFHLPVSNIDTGATYQSTSGSKPAQLGFQNLFVFGRLLCCSASTLGNKKGSDFAIGVYLQSGRLPRTWWLLGRRHLWENVEVTWYLLFCCGLCGLPKEEARSCGEGILTSFRIFNDLASWLWTKSCGSSTFINQNGEIWFILS